MKVNQNNINAHMFAFKSGIRPELNTILITPTKTVATDSYKLIEIDNLDVDTDKINKNRLITVDTVKDIKIKEPINSNNIQELLINELDPEEYPEYKSIIPKGKPKSSIVLSVAHMQIIFNYLKKAKIIHITLETREPTSSLQIKGITPEGQHLKILLMPIA